MIIYNVTVKVENVIHESWLQWMQEIHIPEVVGTGCFTHAVVLRLLEIDDNEGPTYAIQYHATSKALYNRYIAHYDGEMRKRAFDRWSNQFIAFRSVMQAVN